jgi:hypothetical protein
MSVTDGRGLAGAKRWIMREPVAEHQPSKRLTNTYNRSPAMAKSPTGECFLAGSRSVLMSFCAEDGGRASTLNAGPKPLRGS